MNEMYEVDGGSVFYIYIYIKDASVFNFLFVRGKKQINTIRK